MKVFMVLFDWSTTDDEDIEIELFDTYEKAYNRFKEIISNEKNPELSRVGKFFDENGNLDNCCELDEYTIPKEDKDPLWWDINDTNDWNRHDFLDLKIMEVK